LQFLEIQLDAEDDVTVQTAVISIETSESPAVSGEYHFAEFRNNAGAFIKKGFYNGKEVRFMISFHRNGLIYWFHSAVPLNSEIDDGTEHYHALATASERLPGAQMISTNLATAIDIKIRFEENPPANSSSQSELR
jgi:hypothetical protein